MEAGRHTHVSEASKRTVGELIDRYIEEVIPTKKSGQVQIQQLRRWKEQLGDLRLSELSPDRILAARHEIAKASERTSNGTINRYQAALSHVLAVAEKTYGWIEINPIRRVPKLKEPQGRVRYLSDEEREALLTACAESSNPFLLPIVLIALTTGMRRGEIEGLTWGDIDWKEDRILIEETKSGQRRSAPLLPFAKEALAEIRPENPDPKSLAFPGRSGRRPIEIKKAWYAALRQAGIEDFRFHDLRHTAASYLAMDGASVPEIAAVLGHQSHQMAARYAHLSDGHTRSVLERTMGKIFKDD